ncbi:MAG: hypothetical protein M3O74_06795 [Pseudomonadota bacterium]|nr:hypothetical protein [Pseudomonadota bacterium]
MTIQGPKGVFTQGDDCEVDEPLARQLRGQFLVWIHGEDDVEIKSGAQSETVLEMMSNDSVLNIGANVL